MRQPSPWPAKVAALLKSGNLEGALAQIKVAPSVKDLTALQKFVTAGNANPGASRENSTVNRAINDQIVALSSPRLHRSP